MTAIAYVKKEGGSISPLLLQIATDLLLLAEKKLVRILPVFVPTDENILADAASRFQSLPDWHLLPSVFHLICLRWGMPQIDLFATEDSTQLIRFYAWGQTLKAEAFDALLQLWDFDLAYLFPPPALLPRVLNKIALSSGNFILITPFWPSQKWFPPLLDLQIQDVRRLPLLPDVVVDLTTGTPPRKLSLLHLLAWKITGGSTLLPCQTNLSVSSPEVGGSHHQPDTTPPGDRLKTFSLPNDFLSIKSI